MMLTIRLNRDQENAVDLLAKSRGESKSEFVRGLIDKAASGMSGSGSVFQEIREFRKTVQVHGDLDIRALINEGRP